MERPEHKPDAAQTPERGVVLPLHICIPPGALNFRFDRSSGPGGQNVNKVNTRATLTVALADLAAHLPPYAMARLETVASRYMAEGRLVISSEASRSQRTNRDDCIEKLRTTLLEALHRPRTRRPTRPSRGAVERRIQTKKERGQRKDARKPGTWLRD